MIKFGSFRLNSVDGPLSCKRMWSSVSVTIICLLMICTFIDNFFVFSTFQSSSEFCIYLIKAWEQQTKILSTTITKKQIYLVTSYLWSNRFVITSLLERILIFMSCVYCQIFTDELLARPRQATISTQTTLALFASRVSGSKPSFPLQGACWTWKHICLWWHPDWSGSKQEVGYLLCCQWERFFTLMGC